MNHTRTLTLGLAISVAACTTTVTPAPAPAADGGLPVGDSGVAAPVPVDAAACVGAGGDCRGNADACCNGTTCVFDPTEPSKAVCATTCLKDSQCNSGCCEVLIEGTAAVCAPAKYCAGNCSVPGQDCRTQACCANATCVTSTVTGTSCAARCAVGSQCASGCCAPLDNTGELVCSPQTFCR